MKIDNIPYISDVRKQYYNKVFEYNYNTVLYPALEKALDINKTDEYKNWNSKIINDVYNDLCTFYCDAETNDGICIADKQFTIKANDSKVFIFSQDSHCVGAFSLVKTNLNIAKYVQAMRNIGYDFTNISFVKNRKQHISRDSDDFDR